MAVMRRFLACGVVFLVLTHCKSRDEGSVVENTTTAASAASNDTLWQTYCVGKTDDPSVIPAPNYTNTDVLAAAANLSQIAPHSFALYSAINRMYKASSSTTVAKPTSVTPSAHEFLTYLCGEFRDRATLVEAKIRWVKNLYYLPTTSQGQIDPTKDLWPQVVAESYAPFLEFSDAYFNAKIPVAKKAGSYTFGKFAGIDRPIPALTVCETKFIFASYIDEKKSFDDLNTFNAGYAAFDAKFCQAGDRDYYYDFRGDGNFKPNSPESNGMIWHAVSTALQCDDPTHARKTPKFQN